MESDKPFLVPVPLCGSTPAQFDNHIERRLSALRGQFLDSSAFESRLAGGDRVVYEVYEVQRPKDPGEFMMGWSIVHPGKIGREFFMTKGHFHAALETGEVYYVLEGEGFMVMETPEGDCSVRPLSPGKLLYVPPRWAHRSVCTSRQEDLVTFFIYPGNAGHDYGTIEQNGFRKLVLEGSQGIEIVDNPRWKIPTK